MSWPTSHAFLSLALTKRRLRQLVLADDNAPKMHTLVNDTPKAENRLQATPTRFQYRYLNMREHYHSVT